MSANHPKLKNPPIVEAVVDIDCDMSPGLDISAIQEEARRVFGEAGYTEFDVLFMEELYVSKPTSGPAAHAQYTVVSALQFLHPDRRQLLQIRGQGFSFNRLAPYTTLDDYLDEIGANWRRFVGMVKPIQVREVRLRYINRILVPVGEGVPDLSGYLVAGPMLDPGADLELAGFLVQRSTVQKATGNQANTVIASQPVEGGRLPVILDIGVARKTALSVEDWNAVLGVIDSLRALKNHIFEHTLTDDCKGLFA